MSFQNCKVVASDVDPEAYHRTDVQRGHPDYPISNSVLGLIAPCPGRWVAGYVPPESKAKTNGSLFDTLLLSPAQFDRKYIECPEMYSSTGMECPNCGSVTDAKTCRACKCERVPKTVEKPWDWGAGACKEWRETNKDREPVKAEMMTAARTAVQCVRSDSMLADMIDDAGKQVMVVGEWFDRGTGLTVPVKALVDIVPHVAGPFGKWLLDFKTSRSAAMRAWQRDVFNYGYARQAAFFLDMYCAATGEDRCMFGHIVVENYPPFQCEKRLMSVEFVEVGRVQYIAGLTTYCRCLETGHWPGYYANNVIEGWQLVQPEPWHMLEACGQPYEFPDNKEETEETQDEELHSAAN